MYRSCWKCVPRIVIYFCQSTEAIAKRCSYRKCFFDENEKWIRDASFTFIKRAKYLRISHTSRARRLRDRGDAMVYISNFKNLRAFSRELGFHFNFTVRVRSKRKIRSWNQIRPKLSATPITAVTPLQIFLPFNDIQKLYRFPANLSKFSSYYV